MELVYLWVEDYKNIKNQGFNFSPRFEFKYDKKSKELTKIRDDSENYVSIFPDNINITAIVGENGSGKSSILNILFTKKNFFFIFYNNKELNIYLSDIQCNKNQLTLVRKNPFNDNTLFYSLNTSYPLSRGQRDPSISCINPHNIEHLIAEKFLTLNSINFSLFNFKPKKIKYNISFSIEDFWESSEYFKGEFITSEKEKLLAIFLETQTSRYLEYLLYLFNEKNQQKSFWLILSQIGSLENNLIQKLEDRLEEYEIKYIDNKIFDNLINYNEESIPIENLKKIFGTDHINILFNNRELIKIDFISDSGAMFHDLSDGEQRLYSFFIEILLSFKKEFFLVLDEPDNTLHPNWQRKFIQELIRIIIMLKRKVHIIISTHSPFLLSDIQKENIIFLENGKQKEAFKDKQTFGANIHTLLSDGFFMSDGLMGEFAKGKIEEIKEFYFENKDLKKEDANFNTQKIDFESKKKRFEHIQSIIGEPFLQTIIKNYLDELEILFNGKKEFLDNEIKRLENLRDNI